jgi:hypothetical protein
MTMLRHPHGLRVLRSMNGGGDILSITQPACRVLGRSADREQRLRTSWQRNAATGKVEGRWHLDGADPGSLPALSALPSPLQRR